MSFSLVPQILAADIFAITPAWLTERGVTLLCLDLDNTLAPYSEDMPTARVLTWLAEMRAAGIALFMISNSRKPSRVDDYAAACDMPFIKDARKPSPKALRAVMTQMGKTPAETALMGDQIFTDGLAANRAGVLSIVIKPIAMGLVLRLRYGIEQPIRALRKEQLK